MTIRAMRFTPEVLLSAPRRSTGLPNSDGSKILYSETTYSFAEHSKRSEIRIFDVETQQTTLVTDASSASNPNWVGDEHILILLSGNKGATEIRIGRADDFTNSNHLAGSVDGPVGETKIYPLGKDKYAFAITAQSTPDGAIYNPEKNEKAFSSGRLYKSLFVRHWDTYTTANRNSIWLAIISKKTAQCSQFEISKLKNALKRTGLESPIPPFGGTDHFDIGTNGLIFTAKEPDLNPALHTKTNIYLLTSESFWDDLPSLPELQKVVIPGFEGASTGPVFSPNGRKAAFLSMKTDGYESDKNQLFVLSDIFAPSSILNVYGSDDRRGRWDRSPQLIAWNQQDESILYLVAEDHGRRCLFASTLSEAGVALPQMIVRGGAISDVRPLKNGDLFLTSTTLVDNSIYSLLTVPNHETMILSSATKAGSKFGLSSEQVLEIHWDGAREDTSIHAWVIRPSTFNPRERYPLAYLIHGGPQGAWEDAWSTRWNPAVFAEQGYVVICPNPTGSTGYGQDFTDAIRGQWGGLPYEDLVKGLDWIESNLNYVDMDRAVALGASYGGYMMNWIQGHPLGRKFKALVTHDGVFSMTGQMASEELYFPFHDLRGKLWENPSSWERWDPSRFTDNWETPHLIIHNELDYRLTISEGLAAFNTLQAKGVESQFLMFPDENHWVLKPENSLMWHDVVLDWINKHVGLPLHSTSRQGGLHVDLPIRVK